MIAWGSQLVRRFRSVTERAAVFNRRSLVDLLYCCSYLVFTIGICNTSQLGSPWWQFALAWTALEACFFVFGKWRLTILDARSKDLPCTDNLEIVWGRFLELQQVFDIKEFLSGWFLGADAASIKRGNLEDFIAYALFNQEVDALDPDHKQRVSHFVEGVEKAWGVTFAEGRTPGLQYMSWLWEPLRVYHKPLAMYLATEAAARLAQGLLLAMNFQHGQQGVFNYWIYKPVVGGRSKSLQKSVAAAAEELWGLTKDEDDDIVAVLAQRKKRGVGALLRRSITAGEGAMHQVAEHAVDHAVTMAGTAAAAVAAQHPHGQQLYAAPRAVPLSPGVATRSPSRAPPPSIPVGVVAGPEANDGAPPGGHRLQQVNGVPLNGIPRRRRQCADSAASISFELHAPLEAAGAQSPTDSAQQQDGQPEVAVTSRPPGRAKPGVPIVFLHGVGFGTLPYLHFVRDMMKACPRSPMIMVEVRHVALRLCWEAADVDDVARAVVAMLQEHGFSSACIVGHSYGTFCISRFCQLYPQMIHSVCIIDPVCMMTCYPQLLYNFIYKPPTFQNFSSLLGVVDLARYICSRDLTISQSFCRKFRWAELMLWPHDLPARSVVVLSGGDDLVPSELVMAQLKLKAHPAKVMYKPDIGHGGFLISPKWQAEVVDSIRQLVTGESWN